MSNHINNTIGKSQSEVIAYFKEQGFDLDQVFEFGQECEQEVAECERNISSLGYAYRDEVGCSTYGSKERDDYADEQAERANALRKLAETAENYYNELAA